MWKVKRMNTARILNLAIAIGAGNPAARPASGPDGKSISRALPSRSSRPTPHIRIPAKPSLVVTQP
jgi:hypothetical protein